MDEHPPDDRASNFERVIDALAESIARRLMANGALPRTACNPVCRANVMAMVRALERADGEVQIALDLAATVREEPLGA